MADIAKAYVQIIPTTKDIASNIKEALNGSDVEGVGESLGTKLSSGLKKAIIGAGIGTAIGKTIGDAIKNGADFEQLYGGAEKIFSGMDTSKILNDSVNAYKTMGMSANEYLKTINDVGAGFKASMGSEAGYETAKKGLQAISDYASGTGKNVNELSQKFTMITRSASSYQSIADQFSGILPATSKEFLKQAQAAGDLSTQYTSLTQVPIAEYQSAVSNALQRGVDALNLTGNTAKEASSTLSGSVQQMKAAWQNFTTALVVPEIDMGEAFTNLINAFSDVIDNIVPMFEEMAPQIANVIAKAFTELGPKLLNILARTIGNILQSIPEMFSKLDFGGVVTSIVGIGMAFVKIVPAIKGAIEAVIAFNGACAANPYALAAVGLIALGAAAVVAGDAIGEAFANSEVGQEFIQRMAQLEYQAEQTGQSFSFFGSAISVAMDMAREAIGAKVSEIGSIIERIGTMIPNGFGSAVGAVGKKMQQLGDAIQKGLDEALAVVGGWGESLVSKAKDSIQSMVETITSTITEIPTRLKTAGQQMAAGLVQGFMERINQLRNQMFQSVQDIVDGIKNLLGIHSPSRLFKEQIGAMMAAGLEVGFTEEMNRAAIAMKDNMKKFAEESGGEFSEDLYREYAKTPNWYKAISSSLKYSEDGKQYTIENKVVLEGDASKLFKLVTVENIKNKKMTGENVLA